MTDTMPERLYIKRAVGYVEEANIFLVDVGAYDDGEKTVEYIRADLFPKKLNAGQRKEELR